MKVFSGVSGAWNYTIGPALVYGGPSSIDVINLAAMPVVVVAKYIPLEELAKFDFNHVYGFVLQSGSLGDSTRVFYSNQHRATVMQCEGILDAVQTGMIVVIDGVAGKVFLDPDEETLERYEELRLKGPPPEPEGFAEQLVQDAMDFSQIDQDYLKTMSELPKYAQAVDIFLKINDADPISSGEEKTLLDIVKGTDYEASVRENLGVIQEALKKMSPEERAERKKLAHPE